MATDERKMLIHIGAFSFDPLDERPGATFALAADEAPEGPAPVIIQFERPLDRDERGNILAAYGLRLDDYIPNNAFAETLAPEALARVSQSPLVRATTPFRPEFKISPNLGKIAHRTDARKAVRGLWLNVVLFPDARGDDLAKALRKLGAKQVAVHDDHGLGGALHVIALVKSEGEVAAIATLPQVRWIEEVPEHVEDNVNAAGTLQSGAAGTPTIWNQGIHGEGQIIGVIDGGPVDINHCFFRDPVNNAPSLVHRKVLQIRNAAGSAPTGHATFTHGCAAGDDFNNPGTAARRGGAWAARLVSGNIADIPGTASMLQELTAAAGMGATIHSNSWHDDTAGTGNPATYNQTAADVDSFTWNNEDHLVLGSAGNTGGEQGPPGTAKNAICVGASQADPNEMNFGGGNSGPTADGRRKPDLMAPGCGIQSATVNTACSTGPRSHCATSHATPHTAAAAALVRQYFIEGRYPTGVAEPHHSFVPSGALLKAVLINSCIDMTGIPGYPSNMEGWGLVRLANALFFPGSARNLRVWDTRNAGGLFTGDVREHHVDISTNTQALRVTLAWTDAPSTAGSAGPVVNNLNLEVVSPGAQTFLGNVFAGGVSTTGGTADAVNNVELVLVNAPAAGDWTIRVRGTAVNVGNPGQGYALAVTADMPEAPAAIGTQDVPSSA